MLLILALYLLLGAVAGFFAGLLGIGAGLIMVPALHEIFLYQGFSPDHALRLALGTSMAGIVFNSMASMRAHHRYGAVIWPVVRNIAPGIVLGTLAGSQLVRVLSTDVLAVIFAVFLVLIALQMAVNLRPKPSRALPGWLGMGLAGGTIGLIMSLIAGGGGVLSVPFLIWCNVDVRRAIGTSAAIGFPIALSGTIGYLISGAQDPSLPVWSWGYIYLPALAGVVAASTLTARFGADAAQRLPLPTLRLMFSALLLLVAGRMVMKML